jgi:DNA modification methylase
VAVRDGLNRSQEGAISVQIRDRIVGLRRVKASTLRPNPRNWRTHPKAQQDALRGLLAEVGYAAALVARKLEDGSLELIDGHLRADTTPDQKVPVLVLDVTSAEADLLLASLDPLAALAGTDGSKLGGLLAQIKTDSPALEGMLEGLAVGAGLSRGEVVDDIAPPRPAKPRTRPGDLIVLGPHRLLCGDCRDPAAVALLLEGIEQPGLMLTDPPYGVEYDPGWRHAAGVNNSPRLGAVTNDDVSDWTLAWRLFRGNVAYVYHGGLHSATVQLSLEAADFAMRAQIIWIKPRLVMSRGHYHWKHEPVFWAERPPEGADEEDLVCEESWYAVRKGATAEWKGGRKQTTVWPIGFSGEVTTVHGTQKPVECMARPMRNHEFAGPVYDPFLGSGTTLMAAQQLGRPCVGLELDPGYCDVIVARWEAFTGEKAIRPSAPVERRRGRNAGKQTARSGDSAS